MSLEGRIIAKVPTTLYVFAAGIFLSNGVNLFNDVYGAAAIPDRAHQLLLASGSSIAAAACWTVVAVKIEQLIKTADFGASDAPRRDALLGELWNDVRVRVLAYLAGAIVASCLALLALLH